MHSLILCICTLFSNDILSQTKLFFNIYFYFMCICTFLCSVKFIKKLSFTVQNPHAQSLLYCWIYYEIKSEWHGKVICSLNFDKSNTLFLVLYHKYVIFSIIIKHGTINVGFLLGLNPGCIFWENIFAPCFLLFYKSKSKNNVTRKACTYL